jgi:(R)-2-hydroxyglutarate dehydrogenase
MIPSLNSGQATSSQYVEFISELRLRGFDGDVSASYADSTVLATDNSSYQVTPQAIVFPRNGTDVVRIARLSAEHPEELALGRTANR